MENIEKNASLKPENVESADGEESHMTLSEYMRRHDGKLPETIDEWKIVDQLGILEENPFKDEYSNEELLREVLKDYPRE